MGNIILLYISGGLVTYIGLVVYVGWLISKKHDCSLLEGISRYENGETPGVVIFAVLLMVAIWPVHVLGLILGRWKPYWTKAIDDLNL